MRRGFTIVELVITITIMGILLTLAVVNLVSTQVGARDAERKADIESIQMHLEEFYRSDSSWGANVNRYPTTALLQGTVDTIKQAMRDIDTKVLLAPGASDVLASFVPATNEIQTAAGVSPQPTVSQYVYQPINQCDTAHNSPGCPKDNLCDQTYLTGCRKYNLYYRLEADNTVYMVTSKHQ